MTFTKMHGIGNDYVYVNGFAETVENPAEVAKRVADRHFGIGSDGLILVLPTPEADVRMRMFNADGSEAEMCGNGVRCVAKYAFDHGLTKNNPMRVLTGDGVKSIAVEVENGRAKTATVDMGEPVLELDKIPVKQAAVVRGGAIARHGEHAYDLALEGKGVKTPATFVSMGNPHAVFFVDDVAAIDLNVSGPAVENYVAFPRRINAHWVQVVSRNEVIMRTWERGSGITLACGTGACAVAVAAVLTGRTDRKVLAHLPGGDLTLEWREADNHVFMTGGATEVFTGTWNG